MSEPYLHPKCEKITTLRLTWVIFLQNCSFDLSHK